MKTIVTTLGLIVITLSIVLSVGGVSAQDVLDTNNHKNKSESSTQGIEIPGAATMTDVDRINNKIYVAMYSNESAVSVIDGSSNELLGNIPTGDVIDADYIGIDPTANKIYFANYGNLVVNVIDMDEPNQSIHEISLNGFPKGIDVNPNNSMVYVATIESPFRIEPPDDAVGEIAVINGSTNNVTMHIPLKLDNQVELSALTEPDEIAVIPKTNMIYVPISHSNVVAVIDGNTNREMAPIIVSKSNWFDIDIDNIDNSFYLVNDDGNRIYVVDSITNKIKKTIIGNISGETQEPLSLEKLPDFPHSSIAVNPFTKTVYVGRYELSTNQSSKIYIIDGKTDKMIRSFDVTIKPADMTFNPLTNMTYITDHDGNTITVIDGNTNDILLGKDKESNTAPISIGLKIGFEPFRVKANPITNTVYVLHDRSSEISIIDGNNDNITNTVVFYDSFPNDIDLNSERNLIYITYPDLNLVSVVDGRTNKVIENITDIEQPLYVTVSPAYNEIYITNQSRNVFFINGYNNSHFFTLPVGVVPQDIEIDENLNKMFISYPSELEPENYIKYILSIDREILAGELRFPMDMVPIGEAFSDPILASNPNTGVLYAFYDGILDPTMTVIDTYANRIIANITIDDILYPVDIALDAEENFVYLTMIDLLSDDLGVVSTIDVNNNNTIISNQTLGLYSTDVEVNPVTDTVYITNRDSDTLTIMDGNEHKVTVGVNFGVSPPEAGHIICGTPDASSLEEVSQNYKRYVADASIECDALANSGYVFSSWSGDSNVDPSSSHVDSLDLTRYGELNANFVTTSQINIPSEFWAPLYALIPGFFVPSIIGYLSGRRQRGYLRRYRVLIENTYKTIHENKHDVRKALENNRADIRKIYEEGKISESHLDILNKTISEYEEKLNQS